ncbi:MAG: TerB family tellurite resistance protein [Acidobacteriia bacterium]|nr:TerB family tellurite resistance protein [Terriglobia bacterium]
MSIAKLLHSLKTRIEEAQRGTPGGAVRSDETETVRKIVQQLDKLEPERARYIAAFAYILSRVARADMNISDVETREMERQVVRLSGLPPEQAILVVQIAKTQTTLFGGTENFLVTREFNDMASREQKLSLLDCLFAIAAADQVISSVEEREIRLINDELQLTHDDFIGARLQYRKYVGVLKQSP